MGLLAKFWTWLTTSAKDRPNKGHPDLYPIDVDKLANELNLVAEAKRLGLSGVPSSDARVLAGPEAAIVQRVEKARQDYVDWAVRRLGILGEDLAKKNVTKYVNRALQADKEFEREASSLLTNNESSLRKLREDAQQGKSELEEFRREHKLTREAKYPGPSKSFVLTGALFLMGIFEAGVNAVFFAEGDELGLTGGFAHAALFAGGNVFIAYHLGKHGFRQFFHRNSIRRVVGFCLLGVAVASMFIFGLTIAHLRDALSAGLPDAQSVALKTLLESPFGLNGTKSWGLFGISIVFGLLSFADGLAIDDLYPGYGKVSRHANASRNEYDEAIDIVRTQLEELKNEHLAELDREVQAAQIAISLTEALIHDKEATGLRLSNALRDADNSLDALLKKFRTENEIHRDGRPIPSYFQTTPELESLNLPKFDISDDKVSRIEQQALVNQLLSEVQALRGRIQEAFNNQFDHLQPLDIQFSAKGQS